MRWVKEILPPRPRRRWLLMTIRLSPSNFAGTVRTLVAVGTPRDASMLATTWAAAPRSGAVCAPVPGGGGAAATPIGTAPAGGAGWRPDAGAAVPHPAARAPAGRSPSAGGGANRPARGVATGGADPPRGSP